jgi:ribonuclease J
VTAPTLTIHRAAHEIGGNCVEIRASGSQRLLIDAGRPLDAPTGASMDLLPKSLDTTQSVGAVLVSHPHQDHFGLVSALPQTWPLYCGRPTELLMRLSAGIVNETISHSIVNWQSGVRFEVGPFVVRPILTDHSAFDAHMLLIEVEGRRILYSGDFRLHGRKGALVRSLMRRPPADLDVLVMEGTNLGSDKPYVTESVVEERFTELFRQTRGRVFVSWSAQNVDRTVSLFRACRRAKRNLAIDLYTAEVMETLGVFGRLPQPGWDNVRVVLTRSLRNVYERKGRSDFLVRMAKVGLSARALSADPKHWVIATRPSLIPDYERKGVRPDPADAWSFSQWSGYLNDERGQALRAWFDAGSTAAAHIHTSGHASPRDLQRFAKAMNARRLVPIHGSAWDAYGDGFGNLCRLKDGETLVL